MAWTPVGGDILFIEATKMPGKGHMQLTGKLGDVMKESAQLALSYIRANGEALGLGPNVTAEQDFHVHVPEGAIPKDGPSAGVTMLTALTSLLTGRRVRSHVAMTGEITLRGNVLPVGGIKEKVIAASRAGIREVILPARNEKDLIDVASEIRDNLKFHFVADMRSVLDVALEPTKGPDKRTSRRKPATRSSSKQAAGRAAKP